MRVLKNIQRSCNLEKYFRDVFFVTFRANRLLKYFLKYRKGLAWSKNILPNVLPMDLFQLYFYFSLICDSTFPNFDDNLQHTHSMLESCYYWNWSGQNICSANLILHFKYFLAHINSFIDVIDTKSQINKKFVLFFG